MYSNKLIQHYKLIKFWTFFGNNFKMIFKTNFKDLNSFYNLNCFLEFKYFFLNFKKIIPLLINLSKINNNLLFIFNKSLYSQTFLSKSYSNIKNINNQKLGLFTNFSTISCNNLVCLDIKKIPCFLISFFLNTNNMLLLEGKKKKIPSIGLITPTLNSHLVDYPIFFNSYTFYSIFFFNKILLVFLLINI